jgi:hypothetical protein
MPDEDSKQLQEEHKQPAAEENGYGKISDNLMLQGFGQWYIELFASDQSVIIFWDQRLLVIIFTPRGSHRQGHITVFPSSQNIYKVRFDLMRSSKTYFGL